MIKSKNKVTLLNIASTIVLQGLAFFSGPIFSGLLGTSNYGIASVYLTWVQLASTVFSLQAAGTVALARINFPIEEQLKYQSSTLFLAFISYSVFSGLTLVAVSIVSKWYAISIPLVVIGLLHGWGMYCISFMNAKFTYEFKADKNFLLSVTTSALTIGLSVLLIYQTPKDLNYWGRIIGQSAIYTSIGLAMFIYVLKSGKDLINKEYWAFTLPIAIPTVFHLLANIVLNQSDRVMLQAMNGNSAAGIYALACTFAAVLSTIWSAFNNSWAPFYYEYTRKKQVDEMQRHARNYVELFTTITIGFILLSREVFRVYARESFWEGTDLIPIFAVGYYFIFLYSFPVNFEFFHKKTKTIAIGTASAAICNIALNYIFIIWWGIQGAVIATALSDVLQFGFHFICAKRINSKEFPFTVSQFVPGILSILSTVVFYWYTREIWQIRWGTGALLGTIILAKIIKRREIF